jgi:FlgD Ig-like domain
MGLRRFALAIGLLAVASMVLDSGSTTCAREGDAIQRMVSKSRILGGDSYLRPLLASQAFTITVTSSAVSGPGPGKYTYTYAVSSASNNQIGVELFGIKRVPPPDEVESPPQWTAFFGFDEEESSVVWACTDTLTEAPPGWDSVQVFPSPYEIQPGQSKTFTMVSKRLPTQSVTFYALGSDTVPAVGLYSGSTGAFDYPTLWNAGVSGTVWGPDIRSVVAVETDENKAPPAHLNAPAPNPTPRAAVITFYMAKRERVRLGIYDAHGRLVKMVMDRQVSAGYYSATWGGDTDRGSLAASGVYFFKLSVGSTEIGTRRVVLLR